MLSKKAERKRRQDSYALAREASLSNPTRRRSYSSAASSAVADTDEEPYTPTTGHALNLHRLTGNLVTASNTGIINQPRDPEQEINFQGEDSDQESAEASAIRALFEGSDVDEDEDKENDLSPNDDDQALINRARAAEKAGIPLAVADAATQVAEVA